MSLALIPLLPAPTRCAQPQREITHTQRGISLPFAIRCARFPACPARDLSPTTRDVPAPIFVAHSAAPFCVHNPARDDSQPARDPLTCEVPAPTTRPCVSFGWLSHARVWLPSHRPSTNLWQLIFLFYFYFFSLENCNYKYSKGFNLFPSCFNS